MKRKKEQNIETVASRNTDMKGKHCTKEWRKLFLEWNRVLNRTKLGLDVVYIRWLPNMCYGQILYRSCVNTQSLWHLRQLTYEKLLRTYRSISLQKLILRCTIYLHNLHSFSNYYYNLQVLFFAKGAEIERNYFLILR
jgi:hypothetical protein